jgi:hypothetical protein
MFSFKRYWSLINRGRALTIWGVVFLLIAAILPTQDRFNVDLGGRKTVVTRQHEPFAYWDMEAGIVLVAVTLIAFGIYRQRHSPR